MTLVSAVWENLWVPQGNLFNPNHCRTSRTIVQREFSKKVENHEAAAALHFMYYNFARVHQALRCTPAMHAGVSDHVWSFEEIVALFG